ncbi:homoserine kinase [Myxococcaceae bacterium GXIMD 01537]
MAVYTALDRGAFARLSEAFGLGEVVETAGIPQGSINTNYGLTTSTGRFFVRHTTVRSAEDLRFEADLLAHLAESHFPAAHMLRTRDGQPFVELEGGRACVFAWLSGEELGRAQLTEAHLEQLGQALGKMHRVTQSFSGQRANPYGVPLVRGWLEGLKGHADAELAAIAEELDVALTQAEAARAGLEPLGIIHADLFMDNVRWVGERVAAFFDFEMACREPCGLDVAITLNAWCFDGGYRPELCRAFGRGYQGARTLAPVERENLFGHTLFGAVRFTASRIRDFHLSPLPPERLVRKDFRTYLARTRALRAMGPEGLRALTGL